jgi:hypothetical protein
VALSTPLFGPASPAGAIPAGDGCNFASGITSAVIGWFPAAPASMSRLKVACTFNNNTGTSQVSASWSIHDGDAIQYHNGAGRTVTTSGATSSGSSTIQLNTASNGIVGLPVAPTQMNRIITGPGIGVRTVVTSMTAGGLLTLNRPTTGAISSGASLLIENANARSVDDATGTAPDLLNSVQANFTAADIGLSVSGTGIPANSTIIAINSPSQAQLSASFTLTNPTVSIGGSLLTSTARQITGATTTSTVRINSAAAGWTASDIGLKVTGTCNQLTATAADDTTIPANTYITATPSGANADTTGGLTSGWSGCTLVVGDPNANAPINGDVAADQGTMLNLNPSLVAGSDDCANDQPEGFGIVARWYNPGSFQGTGATNAQPGPTAANPAIAPTKAIGQLFFDTSAADYSAFVVERKALTAGDPNGAVHYDIVFPFAPTTLALCPSSASSPGLGISLSVHAATSGQLTMASGTGRPGTGQIRSVKPSPTGGYTTQVIVKSDSAVTFSPAGNFNRLCIYPAGTPNPINFQCGAG